VRGSGSALGWRRWCRSYGNSLTLARPPRGASLYLYILQLALNDALQYRTYQSWLWHLHCAYLSCNVAGSHR
jgi:hypothetical protein